jgi:UPF0271 protein
VRSIDLNADVGEGGDDEALLPFVSSANIACGAHAGDAETMRRVVRLAIARGVQVGAHPGYADREGFGRRPMRLTAAGLRELLINQIETLDEIAHAEGTSIMHVKPHGALYNQAERDDDLAAGIVATLQAYHRPLRLLARAGSALERAASAAGWPFLREAFADRRYRGDGSLVPRTETGAVITQSDAVVEQVRSLAVSGEAVLYDGTRVPITFESLCLHGDTPGAHELAIRIRQELDRLGVSVAAPSF